MNSNFEEILKTELESKDKIQKAQEEAERIKQEGINKAEDILAQLKQEVKSYRQQKESELDKKVNTIKKEIEEKYQNDLAELNNIFQQKSPGLKSLIYKLIGLK